MSSGRRSAGAVLAALLLWAPLSATAQNLGQDSGQGFTHNIGAVAAPGVALVGQGELQRIMIVDSQRILREAEAVKHLQADIEAERDAFRDELREHEAELRDDDAALIRERPDLTNEEYLQRRRELEQRFAGYQSQISQRREALEGRFSRSMRTIENRLLEIVGRLAEERGIDLVLPKSAVLLADPRYEATEEVMKRLNRTLPRVVPSEE